MKHPFDGVIVSEGANTQPITRRTAMGVMASAAAGVVGAAGVASAQIATTQAVGEEGAVPPPVATTLALGEEGAATEAVGEAGGPTTRALGEEGGGLTTEPFGEEAGRVTSKAVRGLEDGGGNQAITTKALGEEGGNITTQALGEEGANVTTQALGEEAGNATTQKMGEEGGRPPLTRARGEDGGARPGQNVIVKPGQNKLTDAQMQRAWKDLGDKDVGKALQASAILYGASDGVNFLKDNLKLDAGRVDPQQVRQLVKMLDSDDFESREKAEAELVELGVGALPLIKAAAAETTSVEVRIRANRIAEKIQALPEVAQVRRGIEVLVALRTPEAKRLLTDLAADEKSGVLAELARDAIKRVR